MTSLLPSRIPLAACATLVLFAFLGAGCTRPSPSSAAAGGTPAGTAAHGTKTVYLTFDADMTRGMKAKLDAKKVASWYDPALIDELKKDDVPATVFATGMFAEAYPDLLKDLAADGRFSIQNHTYDHAAFAWPCYGLPAVRTDGRKAEEIARTQDIIGKLTGSRPRLFRYPGLCGHDPHDDALVAAAGLSVNDGTLVSGDAFSRHPDRIVKTVLSRVVDGSVVVMHLGGPNAPSTAAAVAALVPLLRAEGFRFAKL